MITPHESDAEFFTPDDVERDVASLSNALRKKRIQNLVRELLERPDVDAALKKLVVGGHFANEAEALIHAVRTLEFALGVNITPAVKVSQYGSREELSF